MATSEDYILNKIFTIPYLDKMISEKTVSASFVKCVRRYVSDDSITWGEAISDIYSFMESEYRNEYFYKNTILNKLLIEKHDIHKTAALTELPIGKSKADFVMINGRGIVYEIKTELDNLERLESQLEDYSKVFCYVYVVTGKSQLEKVREILDESKVGIYELTKQNRLICRKKAKYNISNLSYKAMFEILRKKEFERILLDYYGELPKVSDFVYYSECFKMFEKINLVTLQRKVMQCLKERTVILTETIRAADIPVELRFYSFFSKKCSVDHSKINEFMLQKMEV